MTPMTASLAVQYIVIAIAVLLSAWVVMKKQFPQAMRRARVAVAVWLLRDGRPRWLQPLARRLAPVTIDPVGACGGCDGCGPAK